MGKCVEINGEKYICEVNYRENDNLRNSFNSLAENTFGINFENWYKSGYWKDEYIPYSIVKDNKVVANVSVNIIDTVIEGEERRFIQLGTVMTDKDYRKKGLSRFLIEKIIKEWEDKSYLIYLYANDSVTEFYPKFGFEVNNEYKYSLSNLKEKAKSEVVKLNIEDTKDKNLFANLINNRTQLYKLNVKNNLSLIMFYCQDFMKDNIYYIKKYNAAVVCEYDEDTLYLHEIFVDNEINIDDLINALVTDKVKKVVLGFTPSTISSYEESVVDEEDTTFFVRCKNENVFKKNKLMMPVLSHA